MKVTIRLDRDDREREAQLRVEVATWALVLIGLATLVASC